jgi:hypothetical protein
MPPQSSVTRRGRLGICLYAGICPSAGRVPWNGPMSGHRGCESGPCGVAVAGIVGRLGICLCGCGLSRPPNRVMVRGGLGKEFVSSGVSLQIAWIAGARIDRIRSWEKIVSRTLTLAMRTSSAGHFVGERIGLASSDCLCSGTKRMCPAGIRMRVAMLWWSRIAAEFHGVSSRTGRIKTTRKGVYMDF